MSRLILNDGQTIMDGRAGMSDGRLWIYLPGYTMQAAGFRTDDSRVRK